MVLILNVIIPLCLQFISMFLFAVLAAGKTLRTNLKQIKCVGIHFLYI